MPQPLRFDSARLKADDAEEIWREVMHPMYEIERSKSDLAAQITAWSLGGTMLLTHHAAKDEVQFRRTRKRIATSDLDQYLVHCLLGGELMSASAEGEQRVPLNSVAVRDMSRENIGFARDAPMLTLSIPRRALDKRMPQGAVLHGACWDAADPVGALVASHMRALAQVLSEMTDEQSSVAAEATLELLAACLLPKAIKREVTKDDPRLAPMLRTQAEAHIERHLIDPELGVASLCKALKVSRTALYDLFAVSGGVAKHVRERRLDEAMRRLVDPKRLRERVGEIGYGVGFASETTFARAFKERFGCAPSEARGEQLAPKKTTVDAAMDNLEAMRAAVISLRA